MHNLNDVCVALNVLNVSLEPNLSCPLPMLDYKIRPTQPMSVIDKIIQILKIFTQIDEHLKITVVRLVMGKI